MGVVFSSGGFSDPAKILTRMMNPLYIILWEPDELEHGIKTGSMCKILLEKYKAAVEKGFPDFNVVEEK